MSDSTEYDLVVSFPDGSEAFVNGFEAGALWQRMQAGESPIEPPTGVHTANREVITRMCAASGYVAEWGDEADGWSQVKLQRGRAPMLRVIGKGERG